MTLEEAQRVLPPIYTICYHPYDFPQHVTVRCHFGNFFMPIACLYLSIEEAREEMLERGLWCLGREAGDDPVIVESWI